jgi:hypothetical protein
MPLFNALLLKPVSGASSSSLQQSARRVSHGMMLQGEKKTDESRRYTRGST